MRERGCRGALRLREWAALSEDLADGAARMVCICWEKKTGGTWKWGSSSMMYRCRFAMPLV